MTNQRKSVGSIKTFLEQLNSISTDLQSRPSIGEKKQNRILFFRGHSKPGYALEPKVYRNAGWVAKEAVMLKELILRCPNDFSGNLSTFQTLVKMQHYGLPTRLLDITSNPLVALHFACATDEQSNTDGEVFIFGLNLDDVKYFDSDTVSVIANLSRRPADFKVPPVDNALDLDGQITAFNETKEIKLLLHDVKQDKPHFEPIIQPAHLGKVVCVKPLLDNPRIIRQEGAFLLFGIDKEKGSLASMRGSLDIEKIVVSKYRKAELAMQLENLGISRATLFPEIEDVAEHISDKYGVADLKLIKLPTQQQEVFELFKSGKTLSADDIAKQVGILKRSASLAITNLIEKKLIEGTASGRNYSWRIRENVKVQL